MSNMKAFRPDSSGFVGEVRLRRPERMQVSMRVECDDDLIPGQHQARTLWAVVQNLDLAAFREPIKARDGVCGRNATDPALLVSLWLYATTRGVGSARELNRLCVDSRPYRWLCGGVNVNYHMLSDFRADHGDALDDLFTQVLAVLVDKGLVKVHRISQDGTRVRACAGAGSFRQCQGLVQRLQEVRAHVAELRSLLEDPEKSAALSARKKAAMRRSARERQQRLEQAMAQMPALKKMQENPKNNKALRAKEPKASTTDATARAMRMPDGGTRPAYNVQLAMDTQSRAIVGVDVADSGSDRAQSTAMRKQVQQRTGKKVREHLVDGGYLNLDQIAEAHDDSVAMYVPAPKRKDGTNPYTPRPEDNQAVLEWRARMADPGGQDIYKLRAQTIETANADLKTHRGLSRFLIKGISKVRCVAIWASLAYNLLHFSGALLG